MELELSVEEQQLLIQILERRHLEFQKEISHTEHREIQRGAAQE